MTRQLAKKLKEKEIELAPVDKHTAKRIKKISKATGQSPWAIISAAIQVLEKSLGRTVVVKSEDSSINLQINHFKKYKEVSDLDE